MKQFSFSYYINYVFITTLFIFFSCNNKKSNCLFTKVDSSDSGIKFINRLDDSEDFNVLKYGYFYNGGGVATADFNNDGFIDIYFTSNIGDDELYINKANGELEFEEISHKANIKIQQGWKTGVSVIDINNDGWMDIYVCRSAAENPSLRRNLLFINNKNLTFTESAKKYGLDDPGYSTQAVFFDYDKDGDLDCFILNHSIQKYAGFSQSLKANKEKKDPNFTSRLMQNNNGFYSDVTENAGLISNVLSFGLGVMVSDYNHDGWLDMYISNDYNEEDYFYINQHDGTFAEAVREATTYTSLFSMGSDAADINDDGMIDLITLDMLPEKNERIKMTSGDDNYEKYQNLLASGFHQQFMRNMLQINSGNHVMYKTKKESYIPQFKEVGQFSGVSNTDWSWSALIADYDNDGSKDIFITNGYEKDYTNMDFLSYTVDLQTKNTSGIINELEVISNMPSIKESNFIFKNEGDLRFSNYSKAWGIDEVSNASGAIYSDLDNDGDLDLVINNLNLEASIFKNNATSNTNYNYIKVDLKNATQSQLIGAKVYIYHNNGFKMSEFIPVRGYQSSMQQPLIFGLGPIGKLDSIKVVWSDNATDLVKNPSINKLIEIKKRSTNHSNSNFNYPLNKTELKNLDFLHNANVINDFKIQPLLPYEISGFGPKLATNTNKTLLYICGTINQPGKMFKYVNGSFVPIELDNQTRKDVFESSATFMDIDGDGDEDLIVVYFGFDVDTYSKDLIPTVYINDKNRFKIMSNIFGADAKINASVVIGLDYDNDKDQDVFIGSRVLPRQYPQSMPSLLLTNDGKGGFTILKNHNLNLGMVTDAIIVKNQKGLPELIVAREFDTVIKLANPNGQIDFSISKALTESGLWFSLASGDTENKGAIDIVAGNVGLNNQLSFVSKGQLSLYDYSFFNSSKSIPLLCIHEGNKIYPFAARDELLGQMPILKKKYSNYALFSKATINDIFGNELVKAKKYTAQSLESVIIKDIYNKAKKDKLPNQIQFSPVKSLIFSDINGDGYDDIISTGSIYKAKVRIGVMDGSDVSVFINNKKGGFHFAGDLGIKGQVESLKMFNNTLVGSEYNGYAKYVQIAY